MQAWPSIRRSGLGHRCPIQQPAGYYADGGLAGLALGSGAASLLTPRRPREDGKGATGCAMTEYRKLQGRQYAQLPQRLTAENRFWRTFKTVALEQQIGPVTCIMVNVSCVWTGSVPIAK